MRWFKITGTPPNFPPHYNAAPGQDLPVIRLSPETGERELGALRWGLIPYWSKDRKIAWKTINARGETVKTAPAFRSAYKSRRCLVPADACYEWKANGKTKQPYAIAMRHGMTVGELARMFNDAFGIGAALHVVPMRGWTRSMRWVSASSKWAR